MWHPQQHFRHSVHLPAEHIKGRVSSTSAQYFLLHPSASGASVLGMKLVRELVSDVVDSIDQSAEEAARENIDGGDMSGM